MKGNFHVQFLGEGVAATSPPYPTPGWATTQVYPARITPRWRAGSAGNSLVASGELRDRQENQWRGFRDTEESHAHLNSRYRVAPTD